MLCLLPNPQGKNLKDPEFQAIGDMLLQPESWELNQAEEYKNDLVQPSFLGVEAVPRSSAQGLVPAGARPDPEGPASDDQWTKVTKMVAWLRFGL